jgi:hypothetical protein
MLKKLIYRLMKNKLNQLKIEVELECALLEVINKSDITSQNTIMTLPLY